MYLYSHRVKTFNKMYAKYFVLFICVLVESSENSTDITYELFDYPIDLYHFELFNLDDVKCKRNACNFIKWVTLYQYNATGKYMIEICQKVKLPEVGIVNEETPTHMVEKIVYERTPNRIQFSPYEFQQIFEFLLSDKKGRNISASHFGYTIICVKHTNPFMVSIYKLEGFGKDAKL